MLQRVVGVPLLPDWSAGISRTRFIAFIGLMAGLACALSSRTAGAEIKKANTLFEAGTKLFKLGKLGDARIKFEASYAEEPTPRALFNLALTEEQLGLAVAARRHFRSYLDAAEANKLTVEQREKAGRHMASLAGKVCTLLVAVPPNATITVDALPASGTLIDVAPGAHLITITNAVPEHLELSCVGGETKRVDAVSLPPPAPPVIAVVPEPVHRPVVRDAEAAGSRSTAGYVVPTALLVVGAAGVGVGALFAGASNRAQADVQSYAGSGACASRQSERCLTYEARRDDQSSYDSYAKVAYISGGVLAAVGFVALVVWPSRHRTSEPRVSVSAEPGGVRVFGSF
jgi:tetratricopeptide (TPR) repeat protein